jgi:hypothetical protein
MLNTGMELRGDVDEQKDMIRNLSWINRMK